MTKYKLFSYNIWLGLLGTFLKDINLLNSFYNIKELREKLMLFGKL